MDKNDAIMIPIPQYPLYTASIALNGGSTAPYYLNESKGWQLDLEEIGDRLLMEFLGVTNVAEGEFIEEEFYIHS